MAALDLAMAIQFTSLCISFALTSLGVCPSLHGYDLLFYVMVDWHLYLNMYVLW